MRRLATGLRRNAREERVLFHYNGHGVPKPTANGEIWVFNRNYTQYIPLSLYDLQSWMGSPSIFVYDCSNAGIIVHAFEQVKKDWRSRSQHDFTIYFEMRFERLNISFRSSPNSTNANTSSNCTNSSSRAAPRPPRLA